MVKVADALQRLIDKSLITHDEARIEVARYIDIDPDNPKGDFDNNAASSASVENNVNNSKENGNNDK